MGEWAFWLALAVIIVVVSIKASTFALSDAAYRAWVRSKDKPPRYRGPYAN